MNMTVLRSNQPAHAGLTVLSPTDIDAVGWQPVVDCPGVRVKELWRSGDLVQALIWLEPGARTPGQPHLAATHHLWIVSGEASIAGRTLPAGSYVHVPAGAAHPIVGRGARGCTVLQLHVPHGGAR